MDSAVNRKRLDKLARVRENQRKSRARKQDHIRELEEKLTILQKDAQQKDIEHRIKVQKLEAENKKLRCLLSCSGLPLDSIEAYLRQVDNPATAQKVAIPAPQRHTTKSQPQKQETQCGRPCSSVQDRHNLTPSSNGPTTKIRTSEKTEDGLRDQGQNSHTPQELHGQSFCGCLPDEDTESSPTRELALNTTLCAIAEGLINQYNTRGVDIAEIQQKLRAGFSRGPASEGCRVRNQLLFEVLDEISSG